MATPSRHRRESGPSGQGPDPELEFIPSLGLALTKYMALARALAIITSFLRVASTDRSLRAQGGN